MIARLLAGPAAAEAGETGRRWTRRLRSRRWRRAPATEAGRAAGRRRALRCGASKHCGCSSVKRNVGKETDFVLPFGAVRRGQGRGAAGLAFARVHERLLRPGVEAADLRQTRAAAGGGGRRRRRRRSGRCFCGVDVDGIPGPVALRGAREVQVQAGENKAGQRRREQISLNSMMRCLLV